MKKNAGKFKLLPAVLALVMLLMLAGCGKGAAVPQAEGPAAAPAGSVTAAPAETSEAAQEPEVMDAFVKRDGERFEDVIVIEGMEEIVRYEHVKNESAGIELDYDYESFQRLSEADRECFVSIYEDAADPWNWLEIRYSPDNADTAAAAIAMELSGKYELANERFELEKAGSCTRIDATKAADGGIPERLQVVYVIPAADGCRIATAHYTFESAGGFGRRFDRMMNSFEAIERKAERSLTDAQALSAVRKYCLAQNPDLEKLISSGEYPVYWDVSSSSEKEIAVLFRSYTGVQMHYYIDRASGDTYVTQFVPGLSHEEELTDESLNIWDYVD